MPFAKLKLATITHSLTFATALVIATLVSGCKQTAPTQTSTSGSPSGTPVVAGTTPSQPSLSASPQILNVIGSQFDTGLIVTLSKPNGQVLMFNSNDVQSLTTTSFAISVTLDVPGTYQLQVKNTNGFVSTPWNVTVGSALQGTLTLTSVTPTSLSASSQTQGIFVSGTNFDPSLQATITAPNSLMSFYGPSAITGLTTTSFTLNATFGQVGTYSIVVSNSSNSISNGLTINVTK